MSSFTIPAIDYTSRDFASIRQSMFDFAALSFPEWTARAEGDFGVLWVELMAYHGDILNWYVDQLAQEAYLPTARNRQSIINLAATLNYRPDNGQPSTVTLTIGVSPGNGRVLVPAGSQFGSAVTATNSFDTAVIMFETNSDVYITQDPVNQVTGTVVATQGRTIAGEVLGTSDGTPAQSFILAQTPVIEASIRVLVDEGAGPVPWVFYSHLIDADPTAPAYTTSTDALGNTTVTFGDGVGGRIPFAGGAITATYRVGGGESGNVGQGSIVNIISAPASVTSVTNLATAIGGTDPETNDQIRQNAPLVFSAMNRAVTLDDYAALSYNTPGVAKANADSLTSASVIVYVAPSGGGIATTYLKNQVLLSLQDKKMATTQVQVSDPVYVPVNISVNVILLPQFNSSTVTNQVTTALNNMLAFPNTSFAQTITVADIYAAIGKIAGIQYAEVYVLARAAFPLQSTGTLILQSNEIPTAGVVTVTQSADALSPGPEIIGGGGTQPVIPASPGAPVVDGLTYPSGLSYAGAFVLTTHWNAAQYASSYNLQLDFYHGTTYRGTYDAGSFVTTSVVVNGSFVGDADTMVVRVTAVNGNNQTPGTPTTVAYAGGSSTATPPPGVPLLPTGLVLSALSLGSQDIYGNLGFTATLTWVNGAGHPAQYVLQTQYLDPSGNNVLPPGQQTPIQEGLVSATGASYAINRISPAGASTFQARLGVIGGDGAVAAVTPWIGQSVQVYTAQPVNASSNFTAPPSLSSIALSSYVRNSDGSGQVHVALSNAFNWQTIQFQWFWLTSSGRQLFTSDFATGQDAIANDTFTEYGGVPLNNFTGTVVVPLGAPFIPPAYGVVTVASLVLSVTLQNNWEGETYSVFTGPTDLIPWYLQSVARQQYAENTTFYTLTGTYGPITASIAY